MVRRLAAVGSIREYFHNWERIARTDALPGTSMATDGDLPGRPIEEFFTTAPPRVRMELPGVNARNWFGGMPTVRNGRATIFQTLRRPSRRAISHLRTLREMTHW